MSLILALSAEELMQPDFTDSDRPAGDLSVEHSALAQSHVRCSGLIGAATLLLSADLAPREIRRQIGATR